MLLASTLGPTPYLVLGAVLFTVGAVHRFLESVRQREGHGPSADALAGEPVSDLA